MKKTCLTLVLATVAVATTASAGDTVRECYHSIVDHGLGSCAVDVVENVELLADQLRELDEDDAKQVAMTISLANYCYSNGYVPGSGACKKFK